MVAREMFIIYGLLLLLQASAVPASVPPPSVPIVYVTRAATASCQRDVEGLEILVCARRDKDRYRLPRLPPYDAPLLPRAETEVAGTKAGVGTEQFSVGGRPSNRVMAHVRIPF